MSKLVVGCGYLGGRVARRWHQAGQEVFVLTRSAERAEQFRREGLLPFVADVTQPEALAGLPAAETVLWSVGFDRRSGSTRRAVYVEGLRAVLDALPAGTRRVVFISSTGVYGESGGGWVDEESPCRPTREAGRVLLAAERMLAGHRLGGGVIVLRLAGFYGPGRIPKLADLLAEKSIPAAAGGYINLIHATDAVSVILAAEEQAKPPRTYNVAGGHPTLRRDFYTYLAGLLGLPRPMFVDPSTDDPDEQRGHGSKRISNARMLAELKVTLVYPSYREGLAAIVPEHRS